MIRALLGPGDDAIDVGAHEGEITDMFRISAPGGRVLAVEPLPHLAAKLRKRYPDDGVIVEERALNDAELGEVEFQFIKNQPGFSGLRQRDLPVTGDVEVLKVQTERLDQLVERHNLKPKLIKIDVEGAEAGVLRGAARTIREHRPAILVEHGLAAKVYGDSLGSFYDLFTDLGLRAFTLDREPLLSRDAFIDSGTNRGYFNFLLRP